MPNDIAGTISLTGGFVFVAYVACPGRQLIGTASVSLTTRV